VLVVRQSHGRGFLPETRGRSLQRVGTFPIGTGDLGLDGVQRPGGLLEHRQPPVSQCLLIVVLGPSSDHGVVNGLFVTKL
jgi:hypothetical protein